MRVNPANSSPIQNTESTSVKKSDKAKANAYDSKSESQSVSTKSGSVNADISTRARDMAKAKQVATDAPDVREAKIAELKAKIANKEYNVSAEAISDKLVDDHLRMAGA